MGINKLTKPFPVSWEEVPIIIDLEYVAAYILGYTTVTLKRLIFTKGFPAFQVGRFWRVDKNKLREWIDAQKVSATTKS